MYPQSPDETFADQDATLAGRRARPSMIFLSMTKPPTPFFRPVVCARSIASVFRRSP